MMTNLPRVSFIIPFFNAGITIEETLDSIYNQDYNNFDVWVINDGTTDPFSLDMLQKLEFLDRVNILHQTNQGPSSARNLGIKKTTSDLVFLLDADNLIVKDALSKLVKFLLENKGDAVFGNTLLFGANTGRIKPGNLDIRKLLLFNSIDTCALIRKDLFEKIEFDLHLSKLGLEDWEFWINCYTQKKQVFYYDIDVQHFRVSENSRTFTQANKNVEQIKTYVYSKHAQLLGDQYEKLYYCLKMERESLDYKIGSTFLKPYRILKQIFK